jgi:parallel beta-helix repeat protein
LIGGNPLLSDGERDFLLLVLGALVGFIEIFALLLGGFLHGLLLRLGLVVLDLVRALVFLRERERRGGEESDKEQGCCEFLHSDIETLRISTRSLTILALLPGGTLDDLQQGLTNRHLGRILFEDEGIGLKKSPFSLEGGVCGLLSQRPSSFEENVMTRYFAKFMAVLALALLPAHSWAVSNAVVGKCKSGTQFTTIQAGINGADAGSTVQVCPGTYPEILTVTKNLTMKGVSSGKNNDVVISVPASGVPQNASSGIWGKLAVQVLAQDANVILSNIAIDGKGATCPTGQTWVGVLFQAAGGSMTGSSVVDAPQCSQTINAFLDLTTNFAFTNNYLNSSIGVGLEIDYSTDTTVTNNLLSSSATSYSGIDVRQLGGPATISGNFLSGGYEGAINVSSSPSVTITGNTMTVAATGWGISVFAGTQNVVSGNKMSGGYAGIYMYDNGVPGGNTVSKNIVIDAYCGFNPANTDTGDTITGNQYFSVTVATCPFLPVA